MEEKLFTLSNGNTIPKVGIGTYKIKDRQEMQDTIIHSLDCGYRLIDTAYFYENEQYLGDVLSQSSIKREDIFLCTKVWPSDFGYDQTLFSIERSLKNLKTDYLDCIYLHWPGDDMEKSWKAFERMYDEKIIKNLAVSNFRQKHFEFLIKDANVKPVINQLEIHPLNQSDDLLEYFEKYQVKLVAWSPIARADKDLFNSEIIRELCEKYDKNPAQIILRWHIQRKCIIIPKSTSMERIKQNIDIFDFELSDEDMKNIKKLNKNFSVSQSPEDEDWLKSIRYPSK